MFAVLLVLHILVAGLMVLSILMQSGQSGGLSGAFGGGGGGGNQSLFGGRGAATFLSKATTYLGAGFLLVSLLLAYVQAHRSAPARGARNIIQEQAQPSPATPMPGQMPPDAALPSGAEGATPGEAGGEAAPEGLLPPGDMPAGGQLPTGESGDAPADEAPPTPGTQTP